MRLNQQISPNWKRVATALLATTFIVAPGQAVAQGAPAQPVDPADAAASAADQDSDVIVVTATKRAENLQDVPIAITAITTKTGRSADQPIRGLRSPGPVIVV
jgi:outer membrane receptor protein involved in Fe transport